MSGAVSVSTPPDDTVSLVVGGKSLEGWEAVTITRGLEVMPGSFDFQVTERFPGQVGQIPVKPGDPCVVKIGADKVIEGYVDRYMPMITPQTHGVRITGRSKCQDLVDCSASLRGAQISGTNLLDLAQKLSAPYGITVSAPDGPGKPIKWIDLILGETPYDIIERSARYSQMLVYDDVDGNLVISEIGKKKAASGFMQGRNVEVASVIYSMDQRFSLYQAFAVSIDATIDGLQQPPTGEAKDEGVPRFRLKIFISEQINQDQQIAQMRAEWERSRRYGRSQMIQVTCDNWRDSAGTLWAPNTLVDVHFPELKVVNQTWVIGQIIFRRGLDGRHADLVLMPKESFLPQPGVLQQFNSQIGQALRQGQGDAGPALGTPPT